MTASARRRVDAPLRRYVHMYRGFRLQLVAFLLLAVLQFALAAPLPFVVKAVFDRAIADARLGLLIALAGLMLVLQLLHSAVGVVAAHWLLRISSRVVYRLRQAVFDKLYSLSMRHHEVNPIGDMHDRIVHETERVDTMTRSGLAIAITAAILAVGIMGVLAVINWALFLVTIAFVPIAWFANRLTQAALRRAIARLHGSVESLSTTALDALRTMRLTRILGAELRTRQAQDAVLADAATAARRHGLTFVTHVSANRFILASWAMLILGVGGAGVIAGRLTLGDLFSFYAGLALIKQPLDQIVRAIPFVIAGQQALGRVYELLDVDDLRPYRGDRQLDVTGHLSVEHVTFEYREGVPVLVDVSVEVEPGEVAALMGPNGSGKTTLASLVLGFYKPAAGRVTVDGVDYRELDISHLRRQYGVLTQHPTMIPGSIRDNITYGRPGASESDVRQAIELAGATQVVAELDEGLDTIAYENGPLLSGGQLQRVALARALLGHPRVLILDEPSTHLDVAGLRSLVRTLASLQQAPATILITHEPEVSALADTVYRMENGRLIRAVPPGSGSDRPPQAHDASSA